MIMRWMSLLRDGPAWAAAGPVRLTRHFVIIAIGVDMVCATARVLPEAG
jgi:hypothetical protein